MLIFSLLLISSVVIALVSITHIRRKFVRNIAERKRSAQQEQTRSRVIELLAYGEPLAVILTAIVHGVEQAQPAMRCSILLLDSEGKRLLEDSDTGAPCGDHFPNGKNRHRERGLALDAEA